MKVIDVNKKNAKKIIKQTKKLINEDKIKFNFVEEIDKDLKDNLINIEKAINIKDLEKRYSFIYDTVCDYLDNKYFGENLCGFDQNGICEYCGKQAVLQSAHKEGEERPQIIKDVLERSFKVSNDWYKVDLSKFEDYFKDAHTPIKDHIFFLCNECHTKYDKKKTISTLDIENKRVLKFKTN